MAGGQARPGARPRVCGRDGDGRCETDDHHPLSVSCLAMPVIGTTATESAMQPPLPRFRVNTS